MVGIDDPGGPDELLGNPAGPLHLVRTGGGAHVDDLVQGRLPLVEGEGPVVERRRQAEAEVDQDLLPGPVVLVHAMDLGHGDVALVDDQQEVGREVVDQGPRARAGLPAREVARVVLDARAVADLAQHLEVERRPLPEARRLEGSTLGFELPGPDLGFGLDVADRHQQLVPRRDVVRGRVQVHLGALGQDLTGQRIDLDDPLDLVPEEIDPDHELAVRRLDLEHVTADPEPGAGQ